MILQHPKPRLKKYKKLEEIDLGREECNSVSLESRISSVSEVLFIMTDSSERLENDDGDGIATEGIDGAGELAIGLGVVGCIPIIIS